MITHGSDYKLLKDLSLLDDPIVPISRSDNLALLRKDIQASIRRAHDRNEKQYNLRSKPVSFKEGQEVYCRNFALKSVKSYYQLEDLQGKEIGTYHAKDIRS
ncbi:PREDICTED: uncharacterized protein LOC108358758 [Rhagoletis zephyria]|uniref:uncharacterized protein LOC108358758 n=1 Tax=Rhagoletis zephyria TaxID=28612 RepID=UPI0008117617|nr:PREDICTED: uncharacterized protein LOC108358758 [Rhagoletis zephyria]